MPRQSRIIPLLVVLAAGCYPGNGPTEPTGQPPLLQKLPRALSAAETAAVAATNDFSFRLLGTLVSEPENAFVSPLSISMALGMVMIGAREATRTEMATTLGFGDLPQQQINEGYRDLISLLRSLDDRVELTIANSLWIKEAFPIAPAFVADAREYFDADAKTLDFEATDAALAAINGWVDAKTNGKIPEILSSIREDERLFAVNAIYFKGRWRDQFRPQETAPGPFHTAAGTTQTVPFMHRRVEKTPYYEGTDFEAVDLWYGAGAHTMTVLLPKPSTTADALAERMSGAEFATVAGRLAPADVELYLPKLRLEYSKSLGETLADLGMPGAFEETADFSGLSARSEISPPERLRITRVEHKTFVEVNEEGTEAAAATAVGAGVTSIPQRVTLRIDRPFLLVIRERFSGAIVFLGRINAIPAS